MTDRLMDNLIREIPVSNAAFKRAIRHALMIEKILSFRLVNASATITAGKLDIFISVGKFLTLRGYHRIICLKAG